MRRHNPNFALNCKRSNYYVVLSSYQTSHAILVAMVSSSVSFPHINDIDSVCLFHCNFVLFIELVTTVLRSRLGMLLPEKYESIFDVSSEGPSSESFDVRSKRRKYFHIFQVEAYLTYCEDIYEVSTYTGSCCS